MIDAERFWAKVDKSGECWEWTAGLSEGYGRIYLNGMNVRAHRLSYILHHPLTIDLWEHREICVCHRCDNRKCVNPSHLFLGSNTDNMKDMIAKGRDKHPKGEHQAMAKLTETQVREIRTRYAEGEITYQQLAFEYGVHFTTISLIVLRKKWKHI